MTAEAIVAQTLTAGDPAVQLRQTRFRQALAAAWGVREGDRLLEIGCGQGDTTAVLAATGATVIALDPAPPGYGAPFTLGAATAHLAASSLGERIEFRLATDPLAAEFPDDAFDAVVLAHCAWYFPSVETLRRTLERVRSWANRLLLSEWDLAPTPDSLAHLLAVVVQGEVEAYRPASESNVRTPLTRARLRSLVEASGWRVVRDETVDSSGLDDGRWEVESCLRASLEASAALGLPPRLQDFLGTQVEILRAMGPGRSLSSFALVAERIDAS